MNKSDFILNIVTYGAIEDKMMIMDGRMMFRKATMTLKMIRVLKTIIFLINMLAGMIPT